MNNSINSETSAEDFIAADGLSLGRASDALAALEDLIRQASDSQMGPELQINGRHLASLIHIIHQQTVSAAGTWRSVN